MTNTTHGIPNQNPHAELQAAHGEVEHSAMSKGFQPERRDLRGSAPAVTGRAVSGYAAKFNTRSENLGTSAEPWYEEIAPGAFPDLATQDCRCLLNHDSSAVLARSKFGKGSLQLSIDTIGLFYRFTAPTTTAGNDLLESVHRGDIDQSSFSFIVEKDEWRKEGTARIRRILKISKLLDVSPVAYPAYSGTSVAARSGTATPPACGPDLALWRRRFALLE